MDPQLERTRETLTKAGFATEVTIGPDREHFGNWVLTATQSPIALRVTQDRGSILLDLMPIHFFESHPHESDWFNWDVVARAIDVSQPTSVAARGAYTTQTETRFATKRP
jgi:hypothetical protein